MTFSSVVSSKGQITIPIEVRVRLGLREGARVEFDVEDGIIVFRPARAPVNPFAAFAGVLDTFPGGADEINAWVSELRDSD